MIESSKRRRRTATEWNELILTWEGSGQGAERFAAGRDFSASSLYLWRKRLRGEGDCVTTAGTDFVPLVLDTADASDAGHTQWQLETRSGVALTMCGPDAVRGLELALRWLDGEVRA